MSSPSIAVPPEWRHAFSMKPTSTPVPPSTPLWSQRRSVSVEPSSSRRTQKICQGWPWTTPTSRFSRCEHGHVEPDRPLIEIRTPWPSVKHLFTAGVARGRRTGAPTQDGLLINFQRFDYVLWPTGLALIARSSELREPKNSPWRGLPPPLRLMITGPPRKFTW
jgi:hypothetical protein